MKRVLGSLTSSPALHPPPFTWVPTDIGASLVGFMDAENNGTITQAGGLASAWADSVSAASFAQATGTKQPGVITSATTGRQVLSFDGTDDFMAIESIPTGWPTGANYVEIIVVGVQASAGTVSGVKWAVSWGSDTAATRLLLGRAGQTGSGSDKNAAQFRVGNGTTGVSTQRLAPPELVGARVVRGISNGTTIFAETDGVINSGTACVPSIGTTRARIGCDTSATPSNFWNGEISAILVANAALSQANLNNLYIWSRIRMGR